VNANLFICVIIWSSVAPI